MRLTISVRIGMFLAITAWFPVASACAADFFTYTNKAAFLAAVSGATTDTFDNLTLGLVASPLNRTIGSYQYTATADGALFAKGTVGDVWLSTNGATSPIDIAVTSGGPTAIGGFFFPTDLFGGVTTGTVNVSINGGQFQQSISTSSTTNFFGWVSTNGTQISSLRVIMTQPGVGSVWPTANDLVFAQAVPEPSTYALGALAAMVLGLVSRRRKTA